MMQTSKELPLGPVMVGIEGPVLAAEERELLCHPRVGGVILFSRNVESPAQVAALNAGIHALRDPPLLIAVDQEGGRVQRMKEGFTQLPPLAALGRIHATSPRRAMELAEATGWLMAAELLSVGVDLSFAPVLDLDKGVSGVIGDRAFHGDPAVVSSLAASYIRGMRSAGMASTGKHFPGHGSVSADSHYELPVDPRPYDRIAAEDLVPFARLAGDLDGVMVAHVLYDRVDGDLAGFSSFWIREVLRERLGFRGAVFSDDLRMAAAGDVEEGARRALRAGCDMVLVCRGLEEAARVIEAADARDVPADDGATATRLAGMRARGRGDYAGLAGDPAWRSAVARVGDYASDYATLQPT